MVSQKESFQFRLISYNVHKKLRKTSYYLHRLLAAIKVRTLVPIMVKKFAPLNAPFHILAIQYKSVSTLSDTARNRLKGGFYDGPDITTVKLIGYNAKNRL